MTIAAVNARQPRLQSGESDRIMPSAGPPAGWETEMDEVGAATGNGQPVRRVALRRFAGESVEVVALNAPSPAPTLEGPRGCRIWSRSDGDTQVYELELPEGYVVRPIDWRRFGADPERVRALIVNCVRDNTVDAVFEPWTGVFRAQIAARLELALKDLSSMIEVVSVGLDSSQEPDQAMVSVEYADWQRRVHHLQLLVVVSP
jgi:hypothetical protein